MTMTDATIATNIHQSLDIQLDLAAEITFNFEFSADNFTAMRFRHACSGANLLQQFLLPLLIK